MNTLELLHKHVGLLEPEGDVQVDVPCFALPAGARIRRSNGEARAATPRAGSFLRRSWLHQDADRARGALEWPPAADPLLRARVGI